MKNKIKYLKYPHLKFKINFLKKICWGTQGRGGWIRPRWLPSATQGRGGWDLPASNTLKRSDLGDPEGPTIIGNFF